MTKVKITNMYDRQSADIGLLPQEDIRSTEIEALADTGAISTAIPEDIADALGAPTVRHDTARVADGRVIPIRYVGPLWIEVVGRGMVGEAIVLPRGTTPLLGAVQLESLDLVVVPSTGEVITNPAHPDGPIVPLLSAA
ncbi:MAG TPA: clan AA aspartic protease [Polyangia bacterium]|jgi:clan AA aspartic protease|nr:clan AA aspartic protease [Polyangia bacterium]